jgi:hypothetical protein
VDISLLPEKKDIPVVSKKRKITARDIQTVFIFLLVVALVVIGGLFLLRSQFLGIEIVPGTLIPQIRRQNIQQIGTSIDTSVPDIKLSWSRVISEEVFPNSDLWVILSTGTQNRLGTVDLLAQTFSLNRLLPAGAAQVRVYGNSSTSFVRNQNSLEVEGGIELEPLYSGGSLALTSYYLDRQNEDVYLLLTDQQNSQKINLITARNKTMELIPQLNTNVHRLIGLNEDRTGITAVDTNKDCWLVRFSDKRMERIGCHLAYPTQVRSKKLWTNFRTVADNKTKGVIYQVDADAKMTNLVTLPEGELANDAYQTEGTYYYIKYVQTGIGNLWQSNATGIFAHKDGIESQIYALEDNELIKQLRLRGKFLYFISISALDGTEKISGIDLSDNSTITVNLDACSASTCYYEFISD